MSPKTFISNMMASQNFFRILKTEQKVKKWKDFVSSIHFKDCNFKVILYYDFKELYFLLVKKKLEELLELLDVPCYGFNFGFLHFLCTRIPHYGNLLEKILNLSFGRKQHIIFGSYKVVLGSLALLNWAFVYLQMEMMFFHLVAIKSKQQFHQTKLHLQT